MTSADRERRTDELIDASEVLRRQLLREVEKLEVFVVALQGVLIRREGHDGDR